MYIRAEYNASAIQCLNTLAADKARNISSYSTEAGISKSILYIYNTIPLRPLPSGTKIQGEAYSWATGLRKEITLFSWWRSFIFHSSYLDCPRRCGGAPQNPSNVTQSRSHSFWQSPGCPWAAQPIPLRRTP